MSLIRKKVDISVGKITLEGGIGHQEGDQAAPGVVICHPHPQFGGSMNNNVVWALFQEFAAQGYVVLAFNFRGVGDSEGVYGEGQGIGVLIQDGGPVDQAVTLPVEPVTDMVVDLNTVKRPPQAIVQRISAPVGVGSNEQRPLGACRLQSGDKAGFARDVLYEAKTDDMEPRTCCVSTVKLDTVEPQQRIELAVGIDV